jgi:hypothetical protein
MDSMGTIFKAKENSMKWFKRWFANKCREAWEEARQLEADVPQPMTKSGRLIAREHDWHENLNISVTSANGGKIVAFRRYDHKTDRNDNRIYVIPDDQDFNAELGKLITLESMRG